MQAEVGTVIVCFSATVAVVLVIVEICKERACAIACALKVFVPQVILEMGKKQ